MTDTLIAKARMRRRMALNAVSAVREGVAPNVVRLGARPTARFASVRGQRSTGVKNASRGAECATVHASGYMKWYDPRKGFGFFVDERTGAEVRIQARSLRKFGEQTISDGSRVEAQCAETERGLQTCEILSIGLRADAA